MKLANANRALVELEKLQTYILNPFHPLGKHKARVFDSALGLKLVMPVTSELHYFVQRASAKLWKANGTNTASATSWTSRWNTRRLAVIRSVGLCAKPSKFHA